VAPVAVHIPWPTKRLTAGEPGRGLRSLARPPTLTGWSAFSSRWYTR